MSEIINTETECRCNKDGWVRKKLGEVCEIKNGKNQKKVLNPAGQYPIYGSGGVMGYADEYICEAGTTIIGRKGTINRPLYVNEPFWNVDTAFGLQPKQECDSRFLFFLCKSIDFTQYDKSVTIPSLVKSDLQKIDVIIPQIEKQRRIVSELDCLNGIIEKQKEQLKQLDELAQSIFYDMFGDPVENEKGWEVSNIEKICTSIIRGPFGSALKKDFFINKNDNAYKIYEQKHAINKNACLGTYYISEEMYYSLQRFEVFPGDVIMSCSGTIGELFTIPNNAEKGIINQALLKFSLGKNIYNLYFLFLMEYVKREFDIQGCGIKNIGSVKELKKLNFGLPPLPLQQSFAQKIEAIERQKELIKQSIAETETLFNSRMDYYFG